MRTVARIGKTGLRRTVTAAAMTCAALAGTVVVSASPAAAADGGCNDGGSNGWLVASCISTAGGYLLPDLYVKRVGNPPFCTIRVTVQREDNRSERDVDNYPCREGHYGPVGKSMSPGVKYRTVVRPSNSEAIYSKWVSS
jgi:hypothetical protein